MATKHRRLTRTNAVDHGGAGNATVISGQTPGDVFLTDLIPDAPQSYALTSAVSLTYADAGPDTIVRGAGSFLTDGWLPSMKVTSDSTLNAGTFTIATVVALTITLIAADALVAETEVSSLTQKLVVPGDTVNREPV